MAVKKYGRFFGGLIFAGILVLAFLYTGIRFFVIQQARVQAEKVIADSLNGRATMESADQEVMALTQQVFDVFQEREPSELWYMHVRPYVTHRFLPEIMKFPDGAIEVVTQKGLCDNAARMLKFVLAQRGYSSVQLNMISKHAAHSALLVTLPDGRQGFVDPFYGFVAMREGRLVPLSVIQSSLREGRGHDLVPLGSKSRGQFYESLDEIKMAVQGQGFVIQAYLPVLKNEKYIDLGEIDGGDQDVKSGSSQYGMTPYWHYVGHKYNREWVRELMALEDSQVQMTLVQDAESGVLTMDPIPKIDGKNLNWDLKTGDKITFHDGRAKISFRRMNSFIGIDRIRISSRH